MMSNNMIDGISIKTNDKDHMLMLHEISKYFGKQYQRMISEMTKDDVRRLWHILHGRSK